MIEELNGDFLQWLRGFHYVSQTGSIRRAAQMMNGNPSTISYQIRSLEEEPNTVLFDRYKKNPRITPEGKKLFEWTIYTFEALRGPRSKIGTLSGELQRTVTFSSNLPFAAQVVEIISGFRERHPDINIRIRRVLIYEVVDSVEGSEVDFGLTGVTVLPDHNELEELFQACPLFIVHRDNTYHLPRKPKLNGLERLPFVSFLSERMNDSGEPYFENMDATLFVKDTVLSVNDYHLMLRYVLHGMEAAIMDEMRLKTSSHGTNWRPLISYPLDEFLPTVRYGILVHERKHLSPQAKGLIENIREELAKTNLPA